MKRNIFGLGMLVIILVFTMMVIGCVSILPAASTANPSITIVNNTGYTVYYVYVSPTTSEDWGSDRLASDQVLMNGQSVSLQLPHPINVVNRYDIRLKDSDGDTYTKMGVSISANSRIEFRISDLDTGTTATVFNGPSITIVNNTGYTVYYVYISPTASDDWGDDRLASNQVIMNGQSASLQLPHPINVVNRYDIRLKDSDGDTYTKMNVLVSANGRIEFTIRDINTAAPAQNNQALAQAAFERGEAAYDQRNWNRAIAEYTEAIRLAPNNPLYYHNRGWVYYENDDYDRAIADFTQTIRIRPNADSYYARSIAYFVNSDDTRALADVNEALRLNPNHQEAKALKDLLLSW